MTRRDRYREEPKDMRKARLRTVEQPLRQAPRELVALVTGAVALFAVVALGGLFAAALPAKAHTPWLIMASYVAPAAVAFVAYWWTAQRQ
jgi:hypothetical protein